MTVIAHDQHRVAFRTFGQPMEHIHVPASIVKELDGIRWRLQGRCVGDQSGAWFDDLRTPGARLARQVCGGCPVRRRCLAAALLYGEEHGIWGGFSPDERARMDAKLRSGQPLSTVVLAAVGAMEERDLDEAV